jgi:tetratricopeptide (TPR) repeat protein
LVAVVFVAPAALAQERAGGTSLGISANTTSGVTTRAAVPAQPAAQAAQPAAAQPAATAAAATGDKTAEGVRRDPKGVRGISPFWEELKLGDNLYLARTFDAALEHYRKATSIDPEQAVGHLRMAEAQLRLNALKDAEQSLVAAARYSATDPQLRAKTFFMLADLRERQNATDEAIGSWRTYAELATAAQPGATTVSSKGATPPAPTKIYQDTATERVKRLETKKELQTQYAAVKERIAKRLQEAEQSAQKNAGK